MIQDQLSSSESGDAPQSGPLLDKVLTFHEAQHNRIDQSWLSKVVRASSALHTMYAQAGVYRPELTSWGLLEIPVDVARLKDSCHHTILAKSNSYELELALVVLAIIGDAQDVPLLEEKIQDSDIDGSERRIAFQAMQYLGASYSQLEPHYHELLSDDLPAGQSLLLALFAEEYDDAKASVARDILETAIKEDHDELIAVFPELQAWGLDTTAALDFVVSNASNENYYPAIAQWAIAVDQAEVYEALIAKMLDSVSYCGKGIFKEALADPAAYVGFKPGFQKSLSTWLDTSATDTEGTIAAMALAGLWAEDLSSYLESDEWVLRAGAYLNRGAKLENSDALLDKETDDDARHAIQFVRGIQGLVGPLEAEEFLAHQVGVGYGLRWILKQIVFGIPEGERWPSLRWDGFVARHKSTDTGSVVPSPAYFHRIVEALTCPGIFGSLNADLPLFPKRFWFHLVRNPDPVIPRVLEKRLLDEWDDDLFAVFALWHHYHRPEAATELHRVLLRVHRLQSDTYRFDEREFEIFAPFALAAGAVDVLAAHGSSVLQHKLEWLSVLQHKTGDTHLAELLDRAGHQDLSESASVAELIMKIQNGTAHSPAVARAFEVLDRGPENVSGYFSLFQALRNRNRESWRVGKIVSGLSALLRRPGLEGVMPGFVNMLSRSDEWQDRQEAARIMSRTPLSYVSDLFRLFLDTDSDVANAAEVGVAEILEGKGLGEKLLIFSDQNDEIDDIVSGHGDRVQNPDAYKEHVGKKFILSVVDPCGLDRVKPATWTVDDVNDIILHLQLDFVDEKSETAVCQVVEVETGEVFNWLLEKQRALFYTLSPA
jgi:hypothetical protein